jgi:hypothetical protein
MAVEAYFWNHFDSNTAFHASREREMIARKNMNTHVPKYAAGVSGTHEVEKTASPKPVWKTYAYLSGHSTSVGAYHHHRAHGGVCGV